VTSDAARMVREFHDKLGIPAQDHLDVNAVDPDLGRFRVKLQDSETLELRHAVNARDAVKIADALADIVYAAYGTALTYGIPLDEVLAEVHRSNLTKNPPVNPGGKAVKGPDYRPPNVEEVLGAR
jgi:predicted HAD superfamily Cof-like phosphohydrolase